MSPSAFAMSMSPRESLLTVLLLMAKLATGADALDEVDWLKTRLESLEVAILAHGSEAEEPPQPASRAAMPESSLPASNDLPADLATSLMEAAPVVPLMVADALEGQTTVASTDHSPRLTASLPREESPEVGLTSTHSRAGGVVPPDASQFSSALMHVAVPAEVYSSAGGEASSSIVDDEEELSSSSTDDVELVSSSIDDDEEKLEELSSSSIDDAELMSNSTEDDDD